MDNIDFEHLHSASFSFVKSVPQIRTHIKSYPSSVFVSGLSGVECGEKKLETEEASISLLSFKNSEIIYILALQELSRTELPNYEKIKENWKKKVPCELEIFVHGGIFSINETRVDNREYYIALRERFDHSKAQKLLQKYRSEYPGQSVSVIPVMMKPSSLKISVNTGNGKKGIVCNNALYLKVKNRLKVNDDVYDLSGNYYLTSTKNKKLELAAQEDIEKLVERILPGEMFLSAPLETLKAQAVAARTDIFMQLGKRHITDPWHNCSEVHCQKIKWEQKIQDKFKQAVTETKGAVILYNGTHVARAPYCSSAGGRTEDIRYVWFTAEKPYLKGVWDGLSPLELDLTKESDLRKFLDMDYGECNLDINKRHRWKVSYTQSQIDGFLKKRGIGSLKKIIPVKRGVSGRIYKIRFEGTEGSETVFGELNIRRMLNNMYSSSFLVTRDQENWVFEGMGWGHGVGMSQMGAISLGKKGKDYKYILNRYYPGTAVVKLY
jgi:SpoIID/LytB domain protein